MNSQAPPLGVYVHWPYCAKICPYCDFNVVRDRGRSQEAAELVAAIVADLEAYATRLPQHRLVSIFIGGGTPSLMAPDDVGQVIERARGLWPNADKVEVTLEANPSDAEIGRFAALSAVGVNRLSLGVQSLDDRELRFLGRVHDAADARRAADRARAAFPRLSIDLIYALPGQTVSEWRSALTEAARLGSEHISPYQLTIEPQTAFGRAVRRGALNPPSEGLAADLYEITQTTLAVIGFEAYEISNHARGMAARSRHNLNVWRGGDYVGVGPGAHGRMTLASDRIATEAPRNVTKYIEHVRRRGIGAVMEKLNPRQIGLERLLMGLRTVEGVATAELGMFDLSPARLAGFDGLAEIDRGRLIATERGARVLDRLIADLADAN